MTARTSILFVCMGNICRSPLAEGVFLHKANCRGVADRFTVDSAGTGGWHAGDPPDPRSLDIAAEYDIVLPSRARQVTNEDFRVFDRIVCMDVDNHETLLAMSAPPDRLSLLLEHDPAAAIAEVPDPYYGGADGFRTVYRLIDSACEALLDRLLAET
jgi:protein-tyrosine phosphatase